MKKTIMLFLFLALFSFSLFGKDIEENFDLTAGPFIVDVQQEVATFFTPAIKVPGLAVLFGTGMESFITMIDKSYKYSYFDSFFRITINEDECKYGWYGKPQDPSYMFRYCFEPGTKNLNWFYLKTGGKGDVTITERKAYSPIPFSKLPDTILNFILSDFVKLKGYTVLEYKIEKGTSVKYTARVRKTDTHNSFFDLLLDISDSNQKIKLILK